MVGPDGRGEPAGRTAVLITGMHRNGTSALARTLSLLGAAIPGDLVPANEGNPHGHWEPRAMVELNDRMLAAAGSDLYSVRDIDPAWFGSSAAAAFTADAAEHAASAAGGEGLILLKDPRTALLAPVWNRALGRAGFRVVHVLPLRHPADVAESLRRRHLKTIPYDAWVSPRGEAVWLRYTLAALHGSRGHARAFLRYGDLLADWRGEVARVGREVGVAWPGLGTEAEGEVDAFLHGNARADGDHPRVDPDVRDLGGLGLATLAALLYAEVAASGDHGARVDALGAEYADRVTRAGDLIGTLEDLYALVWRYFEAEGEARGRLDLSVAAEERLREKARQSWAALTESNNDKLRMLLDAGSRDRQIVSLGAEVARLADAIGGAAAERDAALAAERGRAEAAQAQLDALHASTSWRVTAPLRALSRAVRGSA